MHVTTAGASPLTIDITSSKTRLVRCDAMYTYNNSYRYICPSTGVCTRLICINKDLCGAPVVVVRCDAPAVVVRGGMLDVMLI